MMSRHSAQQHTPAPSRPGGRRICGWTSTPSASTIPSVHQIAFNEISAAEVSTLPPLAALKLFAAFHVTPDVLSGAATAQPHEAYGVMEHEGKTIYRFRTQDYRIYFTVEDGRVIVQRVLHAGSLKDFLFRSSIVELDDEDRVLGRSRSFWNFIDEGVNAPLKESD